MQAVAVIGWLKSPCCGCCCVSFSALNLLNVAALVVSSVGSCSLGTDESLVLAFLVVSVESMTSGLELF